MMDRPVTLTIPAAAEYLDIVRASLYAIANKAKFSFEEIEDMKVAVMEACTNAISHAYIEHSDSNNIALTFLLEDHQLRMSVKDKGKQYDPAYNEKTTEGLVHTPLQEASAGGLGIFLMKALMDEVEVHTEHGTEVILVKRLKRSEEPV